MRNPRAARRRAALVAAVLVATVLAVSAPPAAAGPPAFCGSNSCDVTDETELVQALGYLSGITVSVARINVDASFIISPGTNPTYTGTQELIVDGQGNTLDGNGTAQILSSTGSAAVGLLNVTIDSGATTSGGAAPITATGDVNVVNSTLTGNRGTSSSGTQNGGAIRSFGAVSITDSQVLNNTAETLTGTAIGGAVTATGLIFVSGSTVTGNFADGKTLGTARGGAFHSFASVKIQQSTVSENDAKGSTAEGGAVYATTTAEVTDTVMADNTAESTTSGAVGGAVYATTGATVTQSVLDLNNARGAQAAIGGAVNADSGTITVADSLLVENGARATASVGRGGAIGSVSAVPVVIERSTVRDNNAITQSGPSTTGGGIHTNGGTVTLEDSAIVRNAAQGAAGVGGGVSSGTGSITSRDSTVAGNIAATGAGGLHSGGSIDMRFTTVVDNVAPSSGQLVAPAILASAASVVARPQGAGTVNCIVGNGLSQLGSVEEGNDSCGFDDHPTDAENVPDVKIGPARDNGGPRIGPAELTPGPRARLSAYPLLGSPLIDALIFSDCVAAMDGNAVFTDDQRDLPRPFGGVGQNCDIGAVEVPFAPHGFGDVIPFYEESVRWVTSDVNTPQILLGFDPNTFGHRLNITRGQVARLLYRSAGAPDVSDLPPHGFSDVMPFYEDAVRWTKAQGIFDGFPDNTFRQARPISRGNYVRGLYGLAGDPDVSELPPHGFGDVIPFYEDPVRWAKANGLADGFGDNTFRHFLNIIRGNASRIFYNLAQSPPAWDQNGLNAPANMLFKQNFA